MPSTSPLSAAEAAGHLFAFVALFFALITSRGSAAQIAWAAISALSLITSLAITAHHGARDAAKVDRRDRKGAAQ